MQEDSGRFSTRYPRLARIVPVALPAVVALGALAAVAVWWLARGPRVVVDPAAQQRAAEASAARGALAALFASLNREPDPMAYVQARLGKDDTTALAELVNAYAAWASRGDALAARRLIVSRMLEHPEMKVGLEALLNAVAMDTTPRRQDPLWRDLVEGVGRQWNAMTIDWARDRLQLEANPKAKDLMLESLASLPREKITPAQQNGLLTDLIDSYPSASADQKPALDKALRAMAGQDVVEILNQRGINQGSEPLASIQQINQEIEASRNKYRKVLEQIEQEEREAKEINAREAAKTKR
jgi:hypothetical protein